MKKVIILLVAAFFFTGLFGQEKIVIDEKAALELEKLKTALKSAGLENELGAFIPESEENVIEDALSVDEFIESLESNSTRSTTYISSYRLIPIYQYYLINGQFVLLWNGDVSSSPTITGDDWDGVIHTRETSGGTVVESHTVNNPNYAYLWHDVPTSTPKLCAQLFINTSVYIPGFGWAILPAPFGNKSCGTVTFNY